MEKRGAACFDYAEASKLRALLAREAGGCKHVSMNSTSCGGETNNVGSARLSVARARQQTSRGTLAVRAIVSDSGSGDAASALRKERKGETKENRDQISDAGDCLCVSKRWIRSRRRVKDAFHCDRWLGECPVVDDHDDDHDDDDEYLWRAELESTRRTR